MDRMIHEMPEKVKNERKMLTSEVIVYAEIESFKAGISTRSMPPQCHYQITLKNVTQIRGTVPNGQQTLIIVGDDKPVLNTGMALFGSFQEEHFAFQGIIINSKEDILGQIRSNPPGWVNQVAPWEYDFNHPEISTENTICCPSKKWPAFQATGFSLKVEQIIPGDFKEFQNAYGDGKFTVSVTNHGAKQVCKPLFQDESGKILFEESMIAMSENEPHVWPKELPAKIKQVEFEAGQTITGQIDTLKIKTIQWPNGGMRVYYNFCLGDMIASNFFYYYSACHDQMVEAFK